MSLEKCKKKPGGISKVSFETLSEKLLKKTLKETIKDVLEECLASIPNVGFFKGVHGGISEKLH